MKTRGSAAVVAMMVGLALLLVACGSSDSGVGDSKYPMSSSSEVVAGGAEIYAANCFTCHGDNAQSPLLPEAPPLASFLFCGGGPIFWREQESAENVCTPLSRSDWWRN